MANRAAQNRPFKFGARDRKEFIVFNGELAIRVENDANGNPIYIGKAKAGTLEDEDKWEISNLAWDANNSLLSQIWPQNDGDNASTEYEFVWDDRAAYTYS